MSYCLWAGRQRAGEAFSFSRACARALRKLGRRPFFSLSHSLFPPSPSRCAACTSARAALGVAAAALGGLATPLSLDLAAAGATAALTAAGLPKEDAATPGLTAWVGGGGGAPSSSRLAPGGATPGSIAALALDHVRAVVAGRLGVEELGEPAEGHACGCAAAKKKQDSSSSTSSGSTCGCGANKAGASAGAGDAKQKKKASSSSAFDPADLPRAAAFFGRGTAVRDLDAASLRSLGRSSTPALITFFAPWCGHCQAVKGELSAAAAALARAGSPAVVAAVDCTTHQAACQAAGVRGYPTIKWYGGGSGGSGEDYGGARTADAFEGFVASRARPPPPEPTQLTSPGALARTCLSPATRLCLIAFLPALADTTASDRRVALETLTAAAAPFAGRPYAWAWAAAGDHPPLEAAVGVGGYGWPALVAVVPPTKKPGGGDDATTPAKVAHLKGAFDADGLRSFIEGARTGRVGAAPVAGELRVEAEVAEWDGKDAADGGAGGGDDEFSLADLGLA